MPMRQSRSWFAPASLAILLSFGNAVHAAPIDVAAGKPVTNESGQWSGGGQFAPQNALDGSLAEPDQSSHYWLGRQATAGENFTVNLQARYLITEFDLANTHNAFFNDRSTLDFHIDASNAVDGSGALVGAVTILSGTLTNTSVVHPNQDPIVPDVFTSSNGLKTGGVAYQYIRFTEDTFYDQGGGLNELQAFASPTPEPGTLLLGVIGASALVGFSFLRRRRVAPT
jgi:hypothetical protein